MPHVLRFQTSLRDPDSGRPLGLFRAAGRIEERDRLPPSAKDWLREQLEWFNENLIVPHLDPDLWRAQFWFRDSASDCLNRIWDVVWLLRAFEIAVERLKTTEPGEIVYRDDIQIAAIRRLKRRR